MNDMINENIFDNNDLLNRLQETELEILIEIDKICKNNDISYQLFGGTLLGAVRHKEFIPWDDDIDICMKRGDYERFLLVCGEKLSEKYFLQNYNTEQQFFHSFTRIRKNKTLAIQKQYENLRIHQGVFIDVFPFDNIPNNIVIRLFQFKTISFIRILKEIKLSEVVINHKQPRVKLAIKTILKSATNCLSYNILNKLETKFAEMYKCKNTYYSTLLVEDIKNNYYRCMRNNSNFKEVIELDFEKNMFLAPKNYDEVLQKMYGNYMVLPSVEERKSHHNLVKVEL